MSTPRYELEGQTSQSALALRATPETLELAVNPNLTAIKTRKMDMDIAPPGAETIEIAETYHRLFERNRPQRTQLLHQTYNELGQPADVITMVYCRKFAPLFENWLASCEAHGIQVRHRLIVFTLDGDAHRRSRELGVKACFLDPAAYGQAGGSIRFGDGTFSRTMFHKNAIICDLLGLGANVLFQDVDLIWLRDPLDYLAGADPSIDLHIMYDGHNWFHRPLHANTGFIYARCNAACKAVFGTALGNTAAIFASGSHQKPFNWILAHFLRHNVLNLRVLPQETFLNGHLFNLERGVLPAAEKWRSEGYVVHYSWTHDLQQKRQKMEQFGFVYSPMGQRA